MARKGSMHKRFDHDKFAADCSACSLDQLISYNSDQLVKDRFTNWSAAEFDLTYTMKSVGEYMLESKRNVRNCYFLIMELKDWLNSINQTKKNLIDEDPSLEKEYPPYIVNRCFSGHLDAIMFANEMNQYHFLPKKLQYDFYLNSLRKKKRFSPWLRQDKSQRP